MKIGLSVIAVILYVTALIVQIIMATGFFPIEVENVPGTAGFTAIAMLALIAVAFIGTGDKLKL